MIIFFGVLVPDNEADHRSDLDLMSQAITLTAGDTVAWTGNTIALGQKTAHISASTGNEALPYYQQESKLAIAGDIRLDNRPELFAQLGISQQAQNNYGDARLVLAAYKKWGEYFPERLLGDFSFALWDNIKQKLFCCVDHFGTRGLFYFYNGKKFIFGSTPNQVLATKEVALAINNNKLSTLAFPDANRLFGSESWFENIYPAPSATILTIDKNGISKRKYWTPQLGRELSFKNEAAYAEAFRQVMFRAVGDRLRSDYPVTALLSGGLDSSAVVSVAAKILEKQNKELQVFSAVLPDEHDPLFTDERYFIDQFKAFPNVKINYITAPGVGFFSEIGNLETKVFGPNMISRHYLNNAFIERAGALNSSVILEGGGSELGASNYAYGGYAELFLKLGWARLWREIKSRKTLTGESYKGNLYYNVLKPVLPGLFNNNRQAKHSPFKEKRDHCLQPGFAAELLEALQTKKDGINEKTYAIAANHRLNQLNSILTRQAKARGGADFGKIEFRSPLMDVRLLEFCLNAPLTYKIKNGYNRYMVRAGLDGILPPEIQWRNSKTPFSPDYIRRYKMQLSLVKAFLNGIKPNDPVRRIVNIDKLTELVNIPLADNESGTYAETLARDLVPEGIYLIQFLRRFPEFQTQ